MNWLGRLNKGLDNDQSSRSAIKLVTYAVRGKMPPEVDRLPCPKKKKKKEKKWQFGINISKWGQSPTGGLLRIVYAVTWPVVGTCSMAHSTKVYDHRTKHPSSHNMLIFTVAKHAAQVETSAANLSNCLNWKNSNLVLILKEGKKAKSSYDWRFIQFLQWLSLIRTIHWTGRTTTPQWS